MGKRKSKRNLKKKVQHKAKKLKELTPEELLLNPALLQSPQFKALPLERQFQLTSQLKQLRMMSRGGLGAPTSSISTGNDNSLYHKLMELLNKNSRAENENAQLQTQVNSEKERNKQLYDTNKQIRKQEAENEKELKKKEKLDKANERLEKAQEAKLKTEADIVDEQTKELLKHVHAEKLAETQRQLVKKKNQLSRLQQLTNTLPKKSHESVSTVLTEGQERTLSEQIRKAKDSQLEEQSLMVNQIESLSNNGEKEKSEKMERQFYTPKPKTDNPIKAFFDTDYSFESTPPESNPKPKANNPIQAFFDTDYSFESTPQTDESKKKPEMTEPISESDESDQNLLSPTEVNAIQNEDDLEFKIQIKQEEIDELERLLKIQEQNQQAYEQAQQLESERENPRFKEWLESNKRYTLNALDEFLKSIPNPNPEYRKELTERIKNCNNRNEIHAIYRKILIDKAYQETAMKQQEKIQQARDELIEKIEQPSNRNIYGFTTEAWKAKIYQAQTLKQVNDVRQMLIRAKKYQEIYRNRDEPENKSKVQSAIDNMTEVQKFLHTNLPFEQDQVFIDTEKVKGISPKTQKLAPSQDYKFIDIRNYEFDPQRDSLPNSVLLNGVNLINVANRYASSSNKRDFIKGIAWKLACLSAIYGTKIAFSLVKYGGKVFIAAMANPALTSAAIGGAGLMYAVKSLWKGKPSEAQISEALSKADENQILDLINNGEEDEIQKQINSKIKEGIKMENLTQKDIIKMQNIKNFQHEAQERRNAEKRKSARWKKIKKQLTGGPELFPNEDKVNLYSEL